MVQFAVIKSLAVAIGIFALAVLACVALHSFGVNALAVIVVPAIILIAGIVVVALLLAMDNRRTRRA